MSDLLDLIANVLDLLGGSDRRANHRKRVFSPGFIMFAVLVAVVELLLLSAWYAPGV